MATKQNIPTLLKKLIRRYVRLVSFFVWCEGDIDYDEC